MEVSQKLKQAAKSKGIPFNKTIEIFAMERLVARLESDSQIAGHLTYKGGFVLYKQSETERFTRDVDATATAIAKNQLRTILEHVWKSDLNDGIAFGDPNLSELTIESGDYGGFRLALRYHLDVAELDEKKVKKLPRIHIDVAMGEKGPEISEEKQLESVAEGFEPVSWRVQALDFIFAEKFQTLITRGSTNSRGKDIYDMYHLSKKLGDKQRLLDAVNQGFKNRDTELPKDTESYLSELKLDTL